MRKIIFLLISALGVIATGCAPVGPCYFDNEIVDQQFVHRYGVTVPKHHWEETGQNGQVVTTLRDGVTCKQTFYLGRLEGETTYTYPFSSNIEKVQQFSQDQLLKETLYFSSGMPKQETVHTISENTTEVKQWYENGVLKSTEKYSGSLIVRGDYYDQNGHRLSGIEQGSGVRMLRDTYGLLVFTDQFKDGEVEYRTTYYTEGSPKEMDPYTNGVVEGQRKTFYPGGEPKTIETWKRGKQEGLTTIFQNGQKSQEIPYVAGYKQGLGKVYKDGATVVQEVTWKDDFMHGPCVTYIDNRKATEWYYKGKKVTKGYYDSFNIKPHVEDVTEY